MTLLTLTLLKSKGPRLNAKILRETANVAATKIPLAGQDQRERGLIDAGLFGNLGLGYPFCFDQMAQHRSVGQRRHRVFLGLVLLHKVAEYAQVVLLAGRKLVPVTIGI